MFMGSSSVYSSALVAYIWFYVRGFGDSLTYNHHILGWFDLIMHPCLES